jgi:hypothetical protein
MAEARKPRRSRNLVAALVVLLPIIAFVVYSSFQVSAVECEVCMRYDGRQSCRTTSAATRDEALRSAVDNACALLTSGMTETIRCQRGEPAKTECRDAEGR